MEWNRGSFEDFFRPSVLPLTSDAVFHTYIDVSAAEADISKVPCWFQDKEVTGWWDLRSSLKKDTHAAEGLATTDSGSTVQMSTPEAQPTANSEAENGLQAIQAI